LLVVIQQFTRGLQGLVDVPANDFRERIPRALFERKQQPVNIIINGNGFAHARTMHERDCGVNAEPRGFEPLTS